MEVDERSVVDALLEIDGAVPAGLLDRVHSGGRRRILRRRVYAALGVVVVGAVAIPVVFALRGGDSALEPAQRVYPGLFAPPPSPGSQCNEGTGAGLSSVAHPDLLLLPPVGQDATALVRPVRWNCADPHVALTALKTDGAAVTAGVTATFGAGIASVRLWWSVSPSVSSRVSGVVSGVTVAWRPISSP